MKKTSFSTQLCSRGSVSDDDEASVEFDGGGSEGATGQTDDQSEAEVSDTSDTASRMSPSVYAKKKSRETVPAAPLRKRL